MQADESVRNPMSHPRSRSARRHLYTTLIIAGIGVFIVGLLVTALRLDPKAIPSAMLNQPAMPFTATWIQGRDFLPESTGETVTLEDLKGRPVVLNFWASWCYSCREEAKDFEAVWQKYRDRGVLVLGIAIQDSPEAALKFADYFKKSYLLAIDEDGMSSINYGVTGVPETFLIDRDGIVRHKESGPMTAAKLEELLVKIL